MTNRMQRTQYQFQPMLQEIWQLSFLLFWRKRETRDRTETGRGRNSERKIRRERERERA